MLSRLALGLVALSCGLASGADPNTPHPHKGTLDPFQAGPPPALSAAEKASVEAGKVVQKTVKLPGIGARAMAIFDVPVPPEIVWECILDVPNYPKMVSGVTAVVPYGGTTSIGRGGTMTKAQFTLSFLGYKISYYTEMKYEPRLDSMTFRLDYTRNSDVDDTVGHWHVAAIPGPDGAVHTRVSYSAALVLKMWLPKTVVDMLFATTLGQATSWVAPEAKKRFAAAGGSAKSAVSKPAAKERKECRWTWRGRRCTAVPPPPPPPPPPSWFASARSMLTTGLALALLLYSTALLLSK